MTIYLDVAEVRELARTLHSGQSDLQGRDYFLHHLAPVAEYARNFGSKAEMAGWLHDSIEDVPHVTAEWLKDHSVDPEVVDAVVRVTRVKGEPYSERIDAACETLTSTAVKYADNRLNVISNRSLASADPERARALLLGRYLPARRRLLKALIGFLGRTDVIVLLRRDGFSLDEVGEMLDLSTVTVRKYLNMSPTVPSSSEVTQARMMRLYESDLRHLIKSDTTITSLSEAARMSASRVKGALDAAGIVLPDGRRARQSERDAKRAAEMLAARNAGRSLEDIGLEYGVTKERVRQLTPTFDPANLERNRAMLNQMQQKALSARISATLVRIGSTTIARLAEDLGVDVADVNGAIKQEDRVRLLHDSGTSAAERQRFSDDAIFAELRRISGISAADPDRQQSAKQRGGQVSAAYWDQHRDHSTTPSPAGIIKRYGSWNRACSLAGIPTSASKAGRTARWSVDDCVRHVADFLSAGQGHSAEDYANWARSNSNAPSLGTVRNCVGGWNAVKARAVDVLA